MRTIADIDGDGAKDVFAAVDYESSGPVGLYWYKYPSWKRYTIADSVNFRGDDLASGDIDNDGDIDLVATIDNNGKVYWYENPGPDKIIRVMSWNAHFIGECRGYVKEITVADLDGDGQVEVVARSKTQLSLFKKKQGLFWVKREVAIHPREGMAVGDLDNDGDLDIVLNGFWLATPTDLVSGQWKEYEIDPVWYSQSTGGWEDNAANVVVTDVNGDGHQDVLICHSEKTKWPISWYEKSPRDSEKWTEHRVLDVFNYCETLVAADMDNDGDIDIVAGEMKKSIWTGELIILTNGGKGLNWQKKVIANQGIYHGLIDDIGNDGDVDIIGCRDYNKPPIEWWENLSNDVRQWRYLSVDQSRPKNQMGKMGLVFDDINRDGNLDIIAGTFLYLNPGNDLQYPWEKIELYQNMDVYFSVDVDGDRISDLIGVAENNIYWLEATNGKADSWRAIKIAEIPEGRTQGYVKAHIFPGSKPELIFSRGKNLFYIQLPESHPEKGNWNIVRISSDVEEEGVAAGDLDRDGDTDIVAVSADGHHIVWFENTGRNSEDWPMHVVGVSELWSDRVEVCDINNDGRLDIVSTEESRGLLINSKIYWFEAPSDSKKGRWKRHTVDTLRSVNSMSVADMDQDGDIDIVVAEHTDQYTENASDNLTVIYENNNNGEKFFPKVVERGPHSSHLGARVVDLDKDGDLDIVSIGWKQYMYVHVWENLNVKK